MKKNYKKRKDEILLYCYNKTKRYNSEEYRDKE